MEQRIYLFDSPKLITEMLDSMCETCISECSTEILEVPRPDCGEYESTKNQRDPLYRMMMEKMEHERSRRARFEEDMREYKKQKYSKCYVFVIKGDDEFDFSALDDIAWMNGGLLSEKPAAFFYEKADRSVTLAPDYSLINNIFGSKDDYSRVYDDRFGR